MFLLFDLNKDRKAALSQGSVEWEKEINAPGVSAGILLASIMQTIIGANGVAIILHLQSNVSLNIEACEDVSAFFSLCAFCILCGKSPGSK